MDKIETKYLIAIGLSILIACGLNSINGLVFLSKGHYMLIVNISAIIVSTTLILIANKKIKQYNSSKEFKKQF